MGRMKLEKTVALISRKEGSTRAAFRDYYETRHAMLGMRHFQFRKYLRNHVVAAPPDAGFDVFSEFWQDSVAAAYETMAGPVGDLMRGDERRFMDQSKQRAARAHERLVAGPPRRIDPTPTRKQILLLKRDDAADLGADAFADAAAKWGARLAEMAPSGRIVRVTLDAIEPFENSSFACDAVLGFWLAPGCEGIAFGDLPAGIVVRTAATVESCETAPEILAANYKN
jgi:uncharacterized protein (TIGR02118 family)